MWPSSPWQGKLQFAVLMTHSVASVLHPCAIACNDFHDVQQTVIPHDLLICDAICPDHSQPPNLSKDMLQLMLYSHTCPFSHVTGRIWTCKTATSAQPHARSFRGFQLLTFAVQKCQNKHRFLTLFDFAGATFQLSPAAEGPIQLPHSPSGFDPGDRFNLHKIRLAPIATQHTPKGPALPINLPINGQAERQQLPISEGWTGPGPVAEGLEVEMTAASDPGMSDAGSSRAGDDPPGAKWGVFKGNFWKRCDIQSAI